MEGERRTSAAPGPWYLPFLAYGGGIVAVIGGLILVATSAYPFVVLGFALVALGVAGVLASVFLLLGRIADPRLRKASRALYVVFLLGYFLAVVNPLGGDVAKSFYTDLTAGSMTGLIVLLAGEYVRRGNLAG
jgi:hypothetical protein